MSWLSPVKLIFHAAPVFLSLFLYFPPGKVSNKVQMKRVAIKLCGFSTASLHFSNLFRPSAK